MDNRCTQNLRDGFRAFQDCIFSIVVFKAVTHPIPNNIFKRKRLIEFDLLLPPSFAFGNVQVSLRAPQNMVLRIQDFHD